MESPSPYRHILVYGLLLALVIESVTVLLRFGVGLQSSHDTQFLSAFTFGLRVHHGYIGILLIAFACCLPDSWKIAAWILGIGLVVSDAMHHFLVLWPLTGSPQFDLWYVLRK
jgi:hypothetical protein